MRTRYMILCLSLLLPFMHGKGEEFALSLEECLELGLNNSLSLKSAEAEVSGAKILEGSYLDLPNTNISLVQTTTDGGGPDNGLKFSQEFDFPTVYMAKRKYLKSETELQRRKALTARNDISEEIESIYYSLVYQRELISIAEAQDTVYKKFYRVAQANFDAGETSRLELLNARRLMNENSLELEKISMEYVSLLEKFRSLLNVEYNVVPREETLKTISGFDPGDTLNYSFTPRGRMAEGRLEVARRNHQLSKQGYMPSISVGATAQLLLKGFNPYHIDRPRFEQGDFMGIEVGVSVPLFFGAQRAKTRAASKAVEAEELQMKDDANRLALEYKSLYNSYMSACRRVEYYLKGGLHDVIEIARLSTVSYELGEIGYDEHARNLENLNNVKRAYAEAIENYNQIVIKMKYIQGVL